MRAAERVARFLAKIERTPSCWLWMGARLHHGYGQFCAGRFADGRTKVVHAHVVMWRLTHDGAEVPDGQEVMHSCATPWCVNPEHLSIGTHQQNIAEAAARGVYRRQRPGAWVVSREVVHACMDAPRGTIARLAKQHGVSLQTLAQAVRRERAKRRVGRAA